MNTWQLVGLALMAVGLATSGIMLSGVSMDVYRLVEKEVNAPTLGVSFYYADSWEKYNLAEPYSPAQFSDARNMLTQPLYLGDSQVEAELHLGDPTWLLERTFTSSWYTQRYVVYEDEECYILKAHYEQGWSTDPTPEPDPQPTPVPELGGWSIGTIFTLAGVALLAAGTFWKRNAAA